MSFVSVETLNEIEQRVYRNAAYERMHKEIGAMTLTGTEPTTTCEMLPLTDAIIEVLESNK